MLKFNNFYGSVTFVLDSEIKKISGLRVEGVDHVYHLDIDTMEKIALITENKGIQPVVSYPYTGNCMYLYHVDACNVKLMKLVSLEFNNDIENPANELNRLNKSQPLMF